MPSGVYPRTPKPVKDRLLALTIPVPECGCWLFTGCLSEAGYGRFTARTSVNLLAHRVAYEVFVGPIPDGLNVLHRCDVPSCVNPDHLTLGTHAKNMSEMASRGRAQRGERHKGARLTEDQVREIRSSELGCTRMARQLGVSIGTVLDVRARKTWAHVD